VNNTEIFLIAIVLIFTVPYLIWRLARTEHFAPLVVVQILTGILLGPGVLGAVFPEYYAFVFTPTTIHSLNGIAWWAVMMFVWIAGIELDLADAWRHRGETVLTSALALGAPLAAGCAAAALMLWQGGGWMGSAGERWQFVVGVGMACAVTALPILILLMEKMHILRSNLGQPLKSFRDRDVDFDIYDGLMTPGDHRLSVVLRYVGEGGEVVRYLEGYHFQVRSSYAFSAPPGQRTNVTVRTFERGIDVPYSERLSLEYDRRVSPFAPR
jgi:hypothetical protein